MKVAKIPILSPDLSARGCIRLQFLYRYRKIKPCIVRRPVVEGTEFKCVLCQWRSLLLAMHAETSFRPSNWG